MKKVLILSFLFATSNLFCPNKKKQNGWNNKEHRESLSNARQLYQICTNKKTEKSTMLSYLLKLEQQKNNKKHR